MYLALALSAICLSSCTPVPVYADAFPPGFKSGNVKPYPKIASASNKPLILPKLEVGPILPRLSEALGPLPNASDVKGGSAPGLIYDSPVTGRSSVLSPSPLSLWKGSPEDWNPPGLDRPITDDPKDNWRPDRPKPPIPRPKPKPKPDPEVAGPIPLMGIAAAFGWSRKLRQRIGK
jgi:hypothetical protein